MNSFLTLEQKINCEHLAHAAICHLGVARIDGLIAAFWRWLNVNKSYERRDELQYIIDLLLDFPKQEG